MKLRPRYVLVLLGVGAAAVGTTFLLGGQSRSSRSIYWGAYVEGHSTYRALVGGTWGNSPWDDKTVAKFERDAGKPMSIEHFGVPPPWAAAFDLNAAQLVVSRGAIPAIDMSSRNAPLAQITAGRYDRSIRSWADAARSFGHPFFFLFDEEMNGKWYPYSPGQHGNTAAEFVAAWRHIHDVMESEGASNVTWVWCPNVDPNHVYTPYSEVYPGDRYVDWTCLNGYNWGGKSWLTFDQVFATSYGNLLRLAPSKPIMIGEVSSAERGGQKGAWITNALTHELPSRFPRVKAVLWFNWRIVDHGKLLPWEIESSPGAQKAFANAIASKYYAPGGSFGNLPLLTKVKPLG